jgi:DNA-binding transcriptional MocR family regulator
MTRSGSRRWSAVALIVELGDWMRPGRPLYGQLADRISRIIANGTIRHGDYLPSERSLATALALSRRTVEAAYDDLRATGLVASRQGRGTWCASAPPPTRRPTSTFVRYFPAPTGAVLDLRVASPPAHPLVAEARTATRHSVRPHLDDHGYTPMGVPPLRARVAEWFVRHGVPTTPDQIVITSGAAQALLLSCASLGPQASIAVENPTSPMPLSAQRWHRLQLRVLPAASSESWESAAQYQAVFVTPAYRNPSGSCLSEARGRELARLARQGSTLVVEDLTFVDLQLDGPPPTVIAAHAPDGNVLSIGSMSKLCWAGMRVGWIRAPLPLVEAVTQLKSMLDLGTPVDVQVQAAWLLERRDRIVADRVRMLRRRRDALAEELRQRLPDWTFELPAGGMSLWARLPMPVADEVVAAGQRRGLAVLGGRTFDIDDRDNWHLRLPFVQPTSVLREAALRFASASGVLLR